MDSALAPVTIQQMIVFLRVVENEGFAKASRHLNMTQSAVSKSIAKLEKELGIILFQRTTREIHLTEAGRLLYDEWREHVMALHDSYVRAAALQNRADKFLHIGILNTERPELYFWDMEEYFAKKCPDIQLEISSAYMTDMIHDLKNGTYDLIMIPDFERFVLNEMDLCWKWAARSHAFVLLNKEHPLAKRASLTTEDILQEDFATLEVEGESPHLEDLRERFARFHAEPKIVPGYRNAYEIRFLFQKQKKALLMTDAFFDCPQSPDIVKVPLTNQKNGIICAWNPDNMKPSIQKFLNLLKPDKE